jgi:hypothetical protein
VNYAWWYGPEDGASARLYGSVSGVSSVASASRKLGRTAHAYVGPSTLVADTTASDEVAALEGTGTVVKPPRFGGSLWLIRRVAMGLADQV